MLMCLTDGISQCLSRVTIATETGSLEFSHYCSDVMVATFEVSL